MLSFGVLLCWQWYFWSECFKGREDTRHHWPLRHPRKGAFPPPDSSLLSLPLCWVTCLVAFALPVGAPYSHQLEWIGHDSSFARERGHATNYGSDLILRCYRLIRFPHFYISEFPILKIWDSFQEFGTGPVIDHGKSGKSPKNPCVSL